MSTWILEGPPAAPAPAPAKARAKARAKQSIALQTSGAAVTATPHAPDPYVLWAEATNWRGFKRGQLGKDKSDDRFLDPVNILACAPGQTELDAVLGSGKLSVAPMYLCPVPAPATAPAPAPSERSLFFTAKVNRADLAWLATHHPSLEWELAVPLREAESATQEDSFGRFGPGSALPHLSPNREIKAPQGSSKGSGPTPLLDRAIAVVDFGCPFLNPRFGDGSQTRIAALWDQDSRKQFGAWCWDGKPSLTGYGRQLTTASLQGWYVQTQQGLLTLPDTETATYRHLGHLIAHDDPVRRLWFASHGAHVLDMAGGRSDPLAAALGLAKSLLAQRNGQQIVASDAAGDAPLVFVQLPALTAADSSGGSLSACLLDAVRYAMAQCTPEAPLVVNISYGTFAGPHDGSSLIERALDDLLLRRPDNFAIVLGAGNARRSQCHTRRTVRKGRSALLRLVLAPQDTTDTFVEVWYPRPADQPNALSARVRTPTRDWSAWIAPGQVARLTDPATGRLQAMLQNHLRAAGSDTQAMLLLSFVPTANPVDDDGPLVDPGVWEIELGCSPQAKPGVTDAITFDAWVERDDPGDGAQGEQARFLGIDLDDEHNTFSSIATGTHTIVAGGYRLSDSSLADYSSLPDLAKALPPLFVYAGCEEDAMHPSIAAAAVRSNDVFRMNGTSVAAPALARRLFNRMMSPPAPGVPVRRGDWAGVLAALGNDPASCVKLPSP